MLSTATGTAAPAAAGTDVLVSTLPKGAADPYAGQLPWASGTVCFDALYDPWPTPLASAAAAASAVIDRAWMCASSSAPSASSRRRLASSLNSWASTRRASAPSRASACATAKSTPSGRARVSYYDIHGQPQRTQKLLRTDYKAEADWENGADWAALLDEEAFVSRYIYDALSRVTLAVNPVQSHRSKSID